MSTTETRSRCRGRCAAIAVALALLAGCGSAQRDALSVDNTAVSTTRPEYQTRRPTPQTFPPTTATTSTTTTVPVTTAPQPRTPRVPVPSVSWPPYQPLPGVTGTAALTGLAIDDASAAVPIIAVKIDNTTAARGQWGLDGADVIFEENVESITRFVALFQSRQPAEIGPVRSARTGDLYLLSGMNRPILAWSGGNAGVTAWVESAASAGRLVNVSALKVHCYRRDSSRAKPHNLVLDTACARTHSADAGSARPLWEFAPADTPATGTLTNEFDVKMDGVRVHWAFDAGNGIYVRYQDGKVHTSAGGVPVTVTNVVIVSCQHIPSPADARSKVPVTVGSGSAVVHSGGMARTGTWTRATDTDPWTFTAADGTPILLAPGTTFVELTRA